MIVGRQPEHGNAIDSSLASFAAVNALKIENELPPNNPTCCPETTAAAPFRKRSIFSRVFADAFHALFWRSRMSETLARRSGS
jgi:hypothetical protein